MADQVCAHCLTPGDKLAGQATGKIGTYAGVEAYLTGDNKSNAIVYSPDIYGHTFDSHHKNADAYAAAGFTVIIPNTMNDALDPNDPTHMSKFMDWLGRNSVDNATAIIEKVVTQALKDFKSVQLVGFCYGARMVADAVEKANGVKGAAVYHPTFLKAEDAALIGKTGTPFRFNCAADDFIFVPELRSVFEKELSGKNGIFKEYPGTQHGFGARPSGEQAQKSRLEALEDTTAFFKKQQA
jgi:dienelactone hydrolase